MGDYCGMLSKIFTLKTNLLLGIGICITAVACGANLSDDDTENLCDKEGSAREVNRRPLFVSRQLPAGQQPGGTTLYSLNSRLMKTTPIVERGADSTDAWALRDTKRSQVFFLERFFGKPSRLTRLACEPKDKGVELNNLPENVFALSYIADRVLTAVGWNKGETTTFSEDFSQIYQSNNIVQVKNSRFGLEEADTHLNTLLVDDKDRYFALSTGYSFAIGSSAQARILQLDPYFQQVVAVHDIPECENAYQDYTYQTSAQSVVVGCNPQYSGRQVNEKVTLIHIKIDNGVPQFINLGVNQANDAQIIAPGGLSKDGKSLFVTEYTTASGMVNSEEILRQAVPGKYLRSYWINLENKEVQPLVGVAGDVIYDRAEKNYVYSCMISSTDGNCRRSVFGVAKEGNERNVSTIAPLSAPFNHDFWHFERPLF